MRIGVFVGASTADLMSLDELIGRIKQAEEDGFDSFWVPHISARGYDALTVLALAGAQTSRIELGVGVVPTYPRHPVAMAQQALTTAAASNGRFVLGLGPSHRPGHRGELWAVLRPAGVARAGVPVCAASAYGRGPGAILRRVLQRKRGARHAGPPQVSGADFGTGSTYAAAGGRTGRRDHHLDGRAEDDPGAHHAAHRAGRRGQRARGSARLRWATDDGVRRRGRRTAAGGGGVRAVRATGELPASAGHRGVWKGPRRWR